MESQNWDSIRGGLPNFQMEFAHYDSIHNELIVSSKFLKKIGSLPARGVARWDGVKWDTLAGGTNTHDKVTNPNQSAAISSCIPYNGKLLVAGGFISIGGIPATGLALWDGVKWDSLPKRAFKYNLAYGTNCAVKKCENNIYIYGQFDSIAGQKASGLAKWDGINFTPIPVPFADPPNGIVSCVEEYQGELYITGGYFTIPGTYTSQADVIKYNGTTWTSATGSGFKSAFSGASVLLIYNNELYVAGHFLMSGGDPGNNIMKYNGSQWQDIGFGPSSGYIRKVIIHNNKIWTLGCYYETAYMPSFSISVYDGVKWCALQDTLNNCLMSGAVYKDTIYVVGGFTSVGGDPNIQYLAKLKNPNLYRSCNGVGIEELESNNVIGIYPNPASTYISVKITNFKDKQSYAVYNNLGQIVLKGILSNSSNTINISGLAAGMYVFEIIEDNIRSTAKLVKHD